MMMAMLIMGIHFHSCNRPTQFTPATPTQPNCQRALKTV